MSETKSPYSGVIWRKGKRVFLRPIERADIPTYRNAINNFETSQFLHKTGPIGEIGQDKWFERVSEATDTNLVQAICLHDGTLIGNIGLHQIDMRNRTATTGSMIMQEAHRGQGYGTEAKMLLLAYAFLELDLFKVCSQVIGFNTRSARYSAKCGYVEEGRLRSHLFRSGTRHDLVQLAVFRDVWLPLWAEHQGK